jgi:hypothetical protein
MARVTHAIVGHDGGRVRRVGRGDDRPDVGGEG